MLLKEMFKENTILLDVDASSRDELINAVANKLKSLKLVKDEKTFIDKILEREAQDSTGMGDGIAIPHILNETVNESRIVFVRSKNKLDWKSMDGQPVNLIFFIMTNGKDGSEHLEALGNLSSVLVNAKNIKKLQNAKKVDDVLKVFDAKKETKVVASADGHYDVIGITACPTGIAHTYLAQEKIIEYAKQLGLTAKVETQGRRGTENKLTQDDVDNAKVIFLAHDKAIAGMGRFNGKEVVETGTKSAIFKGKEIISDALEGKGLKKVTASSKNDEEDSEFSLKKFKDIKGNLLAGVSRMLPFVVAGGIILGIAFLIDAATGNSNAAGEFGQTNKVAGWFAAVGKLSMSIMIPVLAAYICNAIVGPQGIMPGLFAGLTTSNIMTFAYDGTTKKGSWSNLWGNLLPFDSHESGFIGAIVGAYVAALIVFGWTKAMAKLPKGLQGARDIVFVPVLSLLCTAVGMFIINIPLGYVMGEVSDGVTYLAKHNLLLVASAIIGVMMCVDMGGPINKIAYVLGTLAVGGNLINKSEALSDKQTVIMSASMLAGMLPPIMIAICTVVFPRAWTTKDRDAAKVNWLMGACFVTEGAIPFMIKDMKRISVSAVIGGLIIGLVMGLFQITLAAPHGGIFVFALLKMTGFGVTDEGLQRGLGIGIAIITLLGASFISALILGFWRTADIKSGKLALDESNGVKEGYEAKVATLSTKLSKKDVNAEKVNKTISIYKEKITKYDAYASDLKIKQEAHVQKVAEKKAKKEQAKAQRA